MTVPNYPLPFDPSDRRLNDALVGGVADRLVVRTGFPFIHDGPDLERLRAALRWFLYGIALPLPVDERLAEPPGGPVPPGVEGHRQTGRPDDGGFAERYLAQIHDWHCSCGDEPDPDCRVHASRFRRPCGDPDPHGEHRWQSPGMLGSATWTCPGVEGGAR